MSATAGTIISNVALECGIVSAAVADPYASTDQNIVLLRTLLNVAGRELLNVYDWPHLTNLSLITAPPATTPPDDFARFINGTAWDWDKNQQIHPISAVEYETRAALYGDAGGNVNIPGELAMRFWGYSIVYQPTTLATGTDYGRYSYISLNWVATATEAPTLSEAEHFGSGSKRAPTVSTDWVQFDEHAITRLLKAKFLQAKGLDSTVALMEYRDAVEAAKNAFPARTLSLARATGEHLLDSHNIPDTGLGL